MEIHYRNTSTTDTKETMKTTQELEEVADEMRAVLRKHDVAGIFAIATPQSGVSGGLLDATWSHATTKSGHIEVKCKNLGELHDVLTFLIGLQRMVEDKASHVADVVKAISSKLPDGQSFDHFIKRL